MDVVSLKKQLEQSMREGNSILYQSLVFGFFFILSQEFLFLSKLYVLSSTSLFSVNLSLFSLKTKVWTAVTVTPLKSMDFLWCKIKFPLLFIVLVPFAPFFAVHPTHDIPYWITYSFSFFSFFLPFFSSQHLQVSISAHYCQHNWQAAVGSFHSPTGGTFYGRTKNRPNNKPTNEIITIISTSDSEGASYPKWWTWKENAEL